VPSNTIPTSRRGSTPVSYTHLGIYLYTSNYLDNSVSGAQLSPNTGQLQGIANTPFPVGSLPSCVTSVANGSHSSSLVNP